MKVVPERGAATMKKMRSTCAVASASVLSRCRARARHGNEATIEGGTSNATRIARIFNTPVRRVCRREMPDGLVSTSEVATAPVEMRAVRGITIQHSAGPA